MNFQINIFYYSTLLFIYIARIDSTSNKELVITNSGLQNVSPASVGLQFFSDVNNTSNQDFFVELKSDQCCIDSSETLDCNSVQIIGECSDVVKKGRTKRFILVAPALDPYERKGYCLIYVDSRPVEKRNEVMRNTIKIDFDTSLPNEEDNADVNFDNSIKRCESTDEDPLNDCKPVNCDIRYNGNKPHFDKITKRCTEVPDNNIDSDKDEKLYDSVSNRCINAETIDEDDIDYIKSLSKDRHAKDIIIVESNAIRNNSLPENSFFEDDDETKPNFKIIAAKTKCVGNILAYLAANKCTIIVLGTIVFAQCCLICLMVFCYVTRKTILSAAENKKVERKFFNYRQDVSVTTPLIATSNMDTETTGFDYISESSKIDQKIKCYKACHKEKSNDAKISMSDDILSKCLNRRNWNTKTKSDPNQETNVYNKNQNVEWAAKKSSPVNEVTVTKKPINIEKRTSIEILDNEDTDSSDSTEDKERNTKEHYVENVSSEKLIQCHDYNFAQSQGDMRAAEGKLASSMSPEKGAQAYFSNDSIDDFLSERGMIFFAGDNMSKYSFASTTTPSSEVSSKTSKNNIVKNVLSYLSKRTKNRTASDPGVKKSNDKDLEVLHMSRASDYASSASEFKKIKCEKLSKESRSSF